jgi:hypothetical protein
MPWYGLPDLIACGSTYLFDQGTAGAWSWRRVFLVCNVGSPFLRLWVYD